jgi:hypothetical protein
VQNGSLLRGEVLARWQEFVGTGEWMRSLQAQVGRLRDRLTAALSGRPTPAQELEVALESSVEQLLRAEAESAAERTVTAWRALPAGPELSRARTASSSRSRATSRTPPGRGAGLAGVRARPRPQRGRRQALYRPSSSSASTARSRRLVAVSPTPAADRRRGSPSPAARRPRPARAGGRLRRRGRPGRWLPRPAPTLGLRADRLLRGSEERFRRAGSWRQHPTRGSADALRGATRALLEARR